jgi:hypothetical protein
MVKRISSFTVSSTATVDSTVKFGCLYPVAGGGLEFAPFKDTALLFSMTLDDILLPGGYKNGKYIILNNTLDGTNYPAVKAVASSETSMIVLEHLPSYSLMPGHSTSFFPSIWVKGTAPNPETDPAKMPVNFISGADAGKYYQYGSTLNIPLTDQDKGKTVKIYFVANKDPIDCGTATASGDAILQDPRYVSLRWISWVDQPDSTAFVPKPMWTELNKTGSVSYFNTEAYYNGTDNNADDERNIISKVSLLQIPSAIPVTGLPNNNNPVVYNSARSSDLAGLGINTAGNIVQPGLACVYKPDAGSGKVKYLHIQIQINWPVVGVGRACSTAGCDLWVIKKVD